MDQALAPFKGALPGNPQAEIDRINSLNDELVRVVNQQWRVMTTMRELLGLDTWSDGCGGGGPTDLWNGPYPYAVGAMPPTQIKVWFNTIANQLQVFDWQPANNGTGPAWIQAATNVVVSPTPPASHPLGTVWLDSQPKLWVMVDMCNEMTFPVTGGPAVTTGAPITFGFNPPVSPAMGQLWFEPRAGELFV